METPILKCDDVGRSPALEHEAAGRLTRIHELCFRRVPSCESWRCVLSPMVKVDLNAPSQ